LALSCNPVPVAHLPSPASARAPCPVSGSPYAAVQRVSAVQWSSVAIMGFGALALSCNPVLVAHLPSPASLGSLPSQQQPLCSSPACISSAVVFSGYNGVLERWPYRVTPFWSLTCHRQRRLGSLPSRRQPLCGSPACISSAVVFSGYNGVTERWPYRVTPFWSLTCHRQRRWAPCPVSGSPYAAVQRVSAVQWSSVAIMGFWSVGPIV
jgi:hypothetical protein